MKLILTSCMDLYYKDEDGKLYYPLSTDVAVFGKDGKIYTRSGKYFTVLFEFNEE